MTRKSPREIEIALRKMERAQDGGPPGGSETVYDRIDDDELAEYLKRIARELLAAIRYPDIVNLPEPERTKRLFETMREEYGIEEDRDEAVITALEGLPGVDYRMDVRSRFAILTSHVAEQHDLATADGETLAELVEAGRTDEADRLLFRETYDRLADSGGATAREATR